MISALSDPKTFNPALSAESPSIFGLTYEGLVSENPITGETEPRLAESWEFSEDQLSITFTLRENLQWSDGEPLTADDVVFSYNQVYLNEKIPTNSRDGLRVGIEGTLPRVEKVGDRQVKFTITEPFAPFLNNTALEILPEHILQESIEQTDSEGNPQFLGIWGVSTPPSQLVSNGPYRLKNYAVGQRLIFEPNPYYWKAPKPYIAQLVWQIVPNTDTTLLQFRSGDLDVTGVSPEYFSLLKREESRGKFTIYNGGPDYGTTFISFNLNTGKRDGKPLVDPIKSKWFNNLKFRQAVAYAIDRQRMVNNIYRGLGEVQHSPISVQSPFYNDQVKTYDYDPEKAKALLAEAGFSYNAQGQLIDAENNPVRFSFITNAGNKIREAMATQIEQDLEALGMQVDYSPISFNILVDKLSNSLDWDCFLLGLTGGNEPNGGANVWFPEGNLHMFNQAARAGTTPLTDRVINDWEQEIADLYIQAAQELDPEQRKAIYATTQDLAAEYLPFIHLVNNYALGAVRDKIEGVQYSALGGPLWNLEDLTIAAEIKE
ncbi:ABC transporter substrate-binding protein [Synechococcus moorigangaii CMS01]|nr:ABC transporter substrate-binding protein [Synechococcus moorigangaii CMS01]